MKKLDVYELGERSLAWLRECYIEKEEDFLLYTPEEIYKMVVLKKQEKHPHFKTVAKPLLYALRANYHYQKTKEKIPFYFWKKINEGGE